jgi:GNAT superfamily N-acetyltransferase
MNNFQIEKIQSAQMLDACADLLVAAYNAEPWNDQWTKAIALEKLLCFYNSPKFMGWRVLLNGEPVGCCVGNIEPYFTGDYFYLKEMFVAPAMQRKGVGSALMQTVKAALEPIDIKTIILFTGKDLFPFDFYLDKGFNEMDGMRMMHFEA